jgi:hypothetical protein
MVIDLPVNPAKCEETRTIGLGFLNEVVK